MSWDFNIGRLFAYTRRLESDLERERETHALTRQEAAADRRALIDAFARARGAGAVYSPLPPPEDPLISRPAIGPTMIQAREAARRVKHERTKRQPSEEEIEAAALAAIGEPPLRSNGDAEPAEPIAPDQVL